MTVLPYHGLMEHEPPEWEWEQDYQDYCESLANSYLCEQQEVDE